MGGDMTIKPMQLGRVKPLLDAESGDGVYSGSDADWDTGGTAGEGSANDQWKQPCRVATTATLTISTALNNGDTLDGVTLATGDRVLVKDQSTGSQNGIYIVGATPERAADFDDDDEVLGALVYVIAGTTNTATAWKVTNTSAVTVGSTSIVFAAFGTGGGGASFATPAIVLGSSAAGGAASTVIRSDATIAAFDATSPTTQAFGDSAVVGSAAFAARRDHKHAMPTAAVTSSGLTMATARLLGRTTASTGAPEEITVGSGLSLSAGSLTASGGSGITIQYPSLKPGTPTYDFAGSALDGAFSAHSSGGSFATSSCMTQGADPWPGTTLEMQFSAQMGRLQLTHSNTDLDFTWGGVESSMNDGAANTLAFGIAAVDSSGNGIMVASETGAIYFGKVVARQFTTVLDSWAGRGVVTSNQMRSGSMWFRLKRVSGTWTGYASVSGRTWEKVFATDATAYTVATLEFGLFYNTSLTYVGRLLSDYIQVDV